jgi:hypothetical protein
VSTLTDPATEVLDFVRDQWGRPLIVPVGGGKPIAYTRASAAAKTVEDTFNLEMWARRNVVFGMARDPSLVARVIALGGDPSTWDKAKKNAANKIHEAAAEVALANKAADIGTAVHRMTEIVDRNLPLIAGPYEADIAAYVNAVAAAGFDIDPRWIECRMVCDELLTAGTPDRILRSADGRNIIADLKTGGSVDYGGLGWGAQLAAYAHGLLYDVEHGERLDTPPIDLATGIIVHLPAGKGVCTLYEIDLVAGYRAAQLANEIRAVRREAKRWITPLVTAAPVVEAQRRHPSRGAAAEVAVQDDPCPHGKSYDEMCVICQEEEDRCPHGVWCHEACGICEGELPITLGDVVQQLGHDHDEGDTIDDERYTKVRARYEALAPASQFWAATIEAEARRAGVGFRLKDSRSFRRYWLYAALILLAEGGVDDPDAVRALVARATDSDAPLFPTITVGHAVGAMGAEEAKAFVTAAADLCAGRLVADCSGPAMRLVPV